MNGNSNVPHSDIERENKIETLKHGSRIRPTRKYNSISSPRSTNDIIVRLLTVARVLSAVPLFIFVMLLVWKKKNHHQQLRFNAQTNIVAIAIRMNIKNQPNATNCRRSDARNTHTQRKRKKKKK